MTLPPQTVSLLGSKDNVSAVSFFSNETRVVTASDDGKARVYNADTGALLLTFTGHKAGIGSLAVLGDDLVATGDDRGIFCVWCVTAEPTEQCLYTGNHKLREGGAVTALAAIDESRFLAGTEKGWLLFFQHDSGANIAVVHSLPDAHASSVGFYCIETRGHRILTGSDDRTAKVWDVDSRVLCATLRGHAGALNGVAIAARHIATAAGGLVYIWDAVTFALLRMLDKKPARWVWYADITGDSHVLTVGQDNALVVSDLGLQACLQELQYTECPSTLRSTMRRRRVTAG